MDAFQATVMNGLSNEQQEEAKGDLGYQALMRLFEVNQNAYAEYLRSKGASTTPQQPLMATPVSSAAASPKTEPSKKRSRHRKLTEQQRIAKNERDRKRRAEKRAEQEKSQGAVQQMHQTLSKKLRPVVSEGDGDDEAAEEEGNDSSAQEEQPKKKKAKKQEPAKRVPAATEDDSTQEEEEEESENTKKPAPAKTEKKRTEDTAPLDTFPSGANARTDKPEGTLQETFEQEDKKKGGNKGEEPWWERDLRAGKDAMVSPDTVDKWIIDELANFGAYAHLPKPEQPHIRVYRSKRVRRKDVLPVIRGEITESALRPVGVVRGSAIMKFLSYNLPNTKAAIPAEAIGLVYAYPDGEQHKLPVFCVVPSMILDAANDNNPNACFGAYDYIECLDVYNSLFFYSGFMVAFSPTVDKVMGMIEKEKKTQ